MATDQPVTQPVGDGPDVFAISAGLSACGICQPADDDRWFDWYRVLSAATTQRSPGWYPGPESITGDPDAIFCSSGNRNCSDSPPEPVKDCSTGIFWQLPGLLINYGKLQFTPVVNIN